MVDAPTRATLRAAELLMVEDSTGDALLTRDAMARAKLVNTLAVARTGEEALDMLRRRAPHADRPRPDLILLDVNLPRLDGREVLQAIRADPALRPIPVVLLAGSEADLDHLRRSDLQADGYAIKPINLERFTQIIASISTLSLAVVAGGGPAHA